MKNLTLLSKLICLFVFFSFSLDLHSSICWETVSNVGGGEFYDLTFTDSLNGIAIYNSSSSRNPAFKVTHDAGYSWDFVFQDKDSLYIDTTDGKNKLVWVYQSPSLLEISCLPTDECFAVGINSITDTGMVWKSSDFGTSWKKIKTEFKNNFFHIKAIRHDLIYCLSKQLIKSTDNGETWNEVKIPKPSPQDYNNQDLSVFSDGTIIFENHIIRKLGDNDSRIYKSTDFGESWNIIDVNDRFRAFKMVDRDLGYAAVCPVDSVAYIIKTTDGGFNWNTVYVSNIIINDGSPAISFIETYGKNTVGVFGSYPFCIISTDAGKTWPIGGTGLDYIDKCKDANKPVDALFHPDGHVYILARGIKKSIFEVVTNVENTQLIQPELIYPNPANDFITFTLISNSNILQNSKIEIYNTIGQLIYNKSFDLIDLSKETINIDISYLSTGIYFVKFGGNLKKFLKI